MAAASLQRVDDPKAAKALSACRQCRWSDVVTLRRDRRTGHASYHGLQSCGRVWLCPTCSARISASRREEMDTLLAWARAEGHKPALLTLTSRHGRGDDLAALLSALKGAMQRLRQRREWRALGVVGSVTATEVTHGGNGWHPHLHILVMMPAGSDALAALRALGPVWLTCLRAFGLDGNGHALDVQGAEKAGDYVAKWGAAEELTLAGQKAGRSGGRTPWQLLADAESGDGHAARLWREYARAFRGRRQLVWSRGLKALALVPETSDAEAAAEGPADDLRFEALRVWVPSPLGGDHPWKHARRRSVALIIAAETGGCLDAAEFGLADCERWRLRGSGSVLESAG